MSGGFEIKGLSQLGKDIDTIRKNVDEATENALKKAAGEIIDLAKTRIPYEMGDLSDSGWVADAVYAGRTVEVECGFSAPYAIQQHEDLTYSHPGQGSKNPGMGAQGQPKYLESAANEKMGAVGKFVHEGVTYLMKHKTVLKMPIGPFPGRPS